MDYQTFLQAKAITAPAAGINPGTISDLAFPFQRDIIAWALRRGRAAIFADCGMGKTMMQLEWARQIPGRVLILAPLAVAQQTAREGAKFGINVEYRRDGKAESHITVTNYEMLAHFNAADFAGIVLDESSILKDYTSKTRNQVIETFRNTPYRLACTATPAPNDYMELGNHAEFCGAMSRVEMLSMFFVHDGGETQQWRLKGHAESRFWEWMASWAVMIRRPSDLGYDDDSAFTLPPITVDQITVESPPSDGMLISMEAQTLQERLSARRSSVAERAAMAAKIVNDGPHGAQWIVWCNLNAEAETACSLIPGAVNVTGSDDAADKEDAMMAFTDGKIRVLVTKPSICGHGMNWQNCARMVFLGLSDSWECYYQAVRRCWRFGQKSPVQVYIVTADSEGEVVLNIMRKEKDATAMAANMTQHMADLSKHELKATSRMIDNYDERTDRGRDWTMHRGDCVEWLEKIADNSIHFSIFSPPFASLYTYSASDRDMGNCKDGDEFAAHFKFAVASLFRVTMPGRLVSFHCMNLPTSKTRDGVIGIRDFRGELIAMFESAGFIFHSEVCIWKDPVTAMQRTKAIGLLHKQLVKDSCMSRQGIPDYLVTMRKPGENAEPVAGELDWFAGDASTFRSNGRLSIDIWQRYASPVWMDINPSRTLQKQSAREDKDERHICPLQLDVIDRALQLWSNPGDLILSPFAGIGSEGHESVKLGRRFVGIELKESYYIQACANLREAENAAREETLFQIP
jgi:hypothetical protein